MKNVDLRVDLAFCLILLPLMMYAFPVERWWGTYPVFFCSFVAWLYVTYFLYRYCIVPGLFWGGRRRILAVAAMAASLGVTFLFSSYNITSPFHHVYEQLRETYTFPVWGVRRNQQAIWLHYIVVTVFCFAVGMLGEAYRQRLAREEVEYERNKAELAFYKAQVNPHFLFNTLNTLYGLLITHSDKTEAMLEGFISLMKYTYNNASREFIGIAEEVDYIGRYIELQKLRLNGFADVSFESRIQDGAVSVPPMLLITFVENAFKYGISSAGPCFVHIRLEQRRDTLLFRVDNSVFARPAESSGRTGIENCRRRLSLLYPGRYSLDVGPAPGGATFAVRLEIKTSGS